MRKILCISLSLVCFLSVFLAAEDKESQPKVVKIGPTAPSNAPVKEIEVSAKKFEYTPAVIEAPLNTLLKIHLKAIDREHGFEIKSFKDSCAKFKPESPVTVEFYADKPGEYEFKCCKYCGMGHGKMKGSLVVK